MQQTKHKPNAFENPKYGPNLFVIKITTLEPTPWPYGLQFPLVLENGDLDTSS